MYRNWDNKDYIEEYKDIKYLNDNVQDRIFDIKSSLDTFNIDKKDGIMRQFDNEVYNEKHDQMFKNILHNQVRNVIRQLIKIDNRLQGLDDPVHYSMIKIPLVDNTFPVSGYLNLVTSESTILPKRNLKQEDEERIEKMHKKRNEKYAARKKWSDEVDENRLKAVTNTTNTTNITGFSFGGRDKVVAKEIPVADTTVPTGIFTFGSRSEAPAKVVEQPFIFGKELTSSLFNGPTTLFGSIAVEPVQADIETTVEPVPPVSRKRLHACRSGIDKTTQMNDFTFGIHPPERTITPTIYKKPKVSFEL
jgi:hypothetical protein